MSEIDKFFKDKLEGRTFEFKDAYWEAAEQLIEQEENDRRKRFGIWWKFGIFFFLLLGVLGYFFVQPDQTKELSVNPFLNTKNEASENKTLHNDNNNTFDPTTTNANDLLDQESNASTALSAEIEEALMNSSEPSQNQTTATTKTNTIESSESVSGIEDLTVPTLERDKFEKNTRRQIIIKNHIQTEKTFEENQLISPLTLDTLQNIPGANPLPNVSDSTSTKLELAQETTTEELLLLETSTTAEEVMNKPEPIVELALLETLASELEIPEYDCEDCFDFDKVKYKRLKFGVNAESVVYPFETGESWLVGAAAGLIANYSLGRRFAIRSGVQYSSTKGITDNNFYAEDAASYDLRALNDGNARVEELYGFGLRRIETIYPPSSIHSLEIPLLVQFRYKKSTIEAGVQFNYLMGIRGKEITSYSLFPWEDDQGSIIVNPIEPERTVNEVTSKKWLPLDAYKKLSNNLVLGYRYSLTPRLSVGLDAFYRMGGATSKNGVAVNSNVVFGESYVNKFSRERLHFRLGVNWYL